jgi:hypothetical protein
LHNILRRVKREGRIFSGSGTTLAYAALERVETGVAELAIGSLALRCEGFQKTPHTPDNANSITSGAHQALAIRAIVQTHLDGERRSKFVQHGIILVIPGVNRQIFARVTSWEAVRMQRRRGDFVVMDAKFVANAQCLPPRRMSLSCPLPQLFRELIEQPARKFCMVITARFASPVARRSLEITLAMNPITSSRSIVRAAAISRCR